MVTLTQVFNDLFFFQRADTTSLISKNLSTALNENDSFIFKAIICYWLTSMLISVYFATYLQALIGGGLLSLLAWLGYQYTSDLLRRVIFCACLCGFGALFIHQQPGYVEPHFSFYASVYLLTRYKDARPLLIFMLFTLTYYVVFTWLQSQSVQLRGLKIQLYTWGLWDALAFHVIAFIGSNVVFILIIRNHIIDFKTTQALQQKLTVIKSHLDQSVIDRTAQLALKTDHLKSMLDNLAEGLLLINPDKTVHRRYSSQLEPILGTQKIAGKAVMSLLFAATDIEDTTIKATESALDAILNNESTQFKEHQHHLISECRRRSIKGKKTLTFKWRPIVNEQNIVAQLLLGIEDVTLKRRLQSEVNSKDRHLQFIRQILSVPISDFDQFIKASQKRLEQNNYLLMTTPNKDINVLNTLFSNAHTIKSMATAYGLLHITHQMHDCENDYDELRRHAAKMWLPEMLLPQLNKSQAIISEYEAINDKLGRSTQKQIRDVWLVSEPQITSLKNQLASCLLKSVDTQGDDGQEHNLHKIALRRQIDKISGFLELLGAKSLADIISPVVHGLTSLTREQSKPALKVSINPNNILICQAAIHNIKAIFTHIIHNAISHGIESPWERVNKDKAEEGALRVHMTLDESHLNIIIEDDGRGLSLAAIRTQAVNNGYINKDTRLFPEQVAGLIFHSGLSTAPSISESSGRGVGLDAVRKLLSELAGEIEVKMPSDAIDSFSFSPFCLLIYLPASLAKHQINTSNINTRNNSEAANEQ
jgi:hypothetical protein